VIKTQPLTEMGTGIFRGGSVKLTISPPSVSLMSRKCESLDMSQRYRPPGPVTETVFPFIFIVYIKRCPSPEQSLVVPAPQVPRQSLLTIAFVFI
jgi:hypothetical protein